MTTATSSLLAWLLREDGQDLVEYTLLIAFVATISAALLMYNTAAVTKVWSTAASQIDFAAEHGF